MCELRSIVVTVANSSSLFKIQHARALAKREAALVAGEDEQLVGDSFELDGSGSPQLDDDSLMDFRFTYTVMVPGCSGWSKVL